MLPAACVLSLPRVWNRHAIKLTLSGSGVDFVISGLRSDPAGDDRMYLAGETVCAQVMYTTPCHVL